MNKNNDLVSQKNFSICVLLVFGVVMLYVYADLSFSYYELYALTHVSECNSGLDVCMPNFGLLILAFCAFVAIFINVINTKDVFGRKK